jgi:hypothetical protein
MQSIGKSDIELLPSCAGLPKDAIRPIVPDVSKSVNVMPAVQRPACQTYGMHVVNIRDEDNLRWA